MKVYISFLIFIILGCKAKTVSITRSPSHTISSDYIVYSKSAYSDSIVDKKDIGYFTGKYKGTFDQQASVDIKDINNIIKIVREDYADLLNKIESNRIMINMIFDRNGTVNAVSYRIPHGLNIEKPILDNISNNIKRSIKAEILNMHETKSFVLYSVFINKSNLSIGKF